jgi:uncharacterized protein YxjI
MMCPMCGTQLSWVPQFAQWYCGNCRQYVQIQQQPGQQAPQQPQQYPQQYGGGQPYPPQPPQYQQQQSSQPQQYPPLASYGQPYSPQSSQYPTAQFGQAQQGSIWFRNFYRIKKKVLTIGHKYWIEDYAGSILGYSIQKLFKLKEDIRIYTDENQTNELFAIKQTQIIDAWGRFAVIDSRTNATLGFIKRKGLISGLVKDQWEIRDAHDQQVGLLSESTGSGLARKYMRGGEHVPEKLKVELNGRPVAEINQEFKIIGDSWELNCIAVPPNFDRRVLLSCLLLMGMIEREHK